MKDLLHTLPPRLLPFTKPEVRRVRLPRIIAGCTKVVWHALGQDLSTAAFASDSPEALPIKRFSAKAVTWRDTAVFSVRAFLLLPQIKSSSYHKIQFGGAKSKHQREDATALRRSNSDQTTRVLQIVRFSLKKPATDQVLFVDFANTTATVDPVLQETCCSTIELAKLSAISTKFDEQTDVTAGTGLQVTGASIPAEISSRIDFTPLPEPKTCDCTNILLQPVSCERHDGSWRFLNEAGDKCLELNIHNEVYWFRLSDKGLNHGQLAKRVTPGVFLLIVPANWECLNPTSAAFVFQKQESLTVDHRHGYLIHIDKHSTEFPLFRTSEGVEKVLGRHKQVRSQPTITHLDLNRLRWALADEHSDPAKIRWRKKAIAVDESLFAATSSEALWVKLPKTDYIASVYAGFRPRKLRQSKGTFPILLREFHDALDLHHDGIIFYLWIRDLIREHAVPVIKIKAKAWRCKHAECSFVSPDAVSLGSHYGEVHPEHGFRILSYSEAQAKGLYGAENPARIYQCGYNPQHFVAADTHAADADSAIINHIEHDCNEARLQTPAGRPQIRFSIVDEVETIRTNHLADLPVWIACAFCEDLFQKSGDVPAEEFFDHLMQMHRDKLFERK